MKAEFSLAGGRGEVKGIQSTKRIQYTLVGFEDGEAHMQRSKSDLWELKIALECHLENKVDISYYCIELYCASNLHELDSKFFPRDSENRLVQPTTLFVRPPSREFS